MTRDEASNLLQEHGATINTLDNCNALVATGKHAYAVVAGLLALSKAGILDQDNYNSLVAAREHTDSLTFGLRVLNSLHILDQDNYNSLVAAKEHANNMAFSIWALNNSNILYQYNRDSLATVGEHAYAVAGGMVALNNAKILDQYSFNALMANKERAYAVDESIILKKVIDIPMCIISGFITFLGIGAVAAGFIILINSAALGIPAIAVAAIGPATILAGATSILLGVGLFANGSYRTDALVENHPLPAMP